MNNRWHAEPARRIDMPEPGFYQMRLVDKGPKVAVAIHFTNGEWSATIDGIDQRPTDPDPVKAKAVMQIWHSAEQINATDYAFLVQLSQFAKTHDPTHPLANPRKPINLAQAKPPTF
jgi:hypothetical protein